MEEAGRALDDSPSATGVMLDEAILMLPGHLTGDGKNLPRHFHHEGLIIASVRGA